MRRPLREVTDDEVVAFEQDGVICLRGILPGVWLERMGDAIERVLSHNYRSDSHG